MRLRFWIATLLFFQMISISGQKSLTAFRTNDKITVDGKLDELTWQSATKATDFVQINPNPGTSASHNSEVFVMYDDEAIYFGAILYDSLKEISKVLSPRDEFNANTDNLQIVLDTYNDDINAFLFGVSSEGVQYDGKISGSNTDLTLNMVWTSHVQKNDSSWTIEIKIPYSAFRFSKNETQIWGVNFVRYISRNRERSSWNVIKPDFDNWPAQAGTLIGIESITPPVRLALIPYLSGYLDNNGNNTNTNFNAGMDVKLGLNEAFTLDVTLVPDFGQVVFDNQVLNLSPFEIQFNENRQFFTEGTELFTKAGLFYSRRIGIQAPYAVLTTQLQPNESLINYSGSSDLLNASKFSGRTKKGLGIGVFNGITDKQSGTALNENTGQTREIVISPLSNFNVFVLDQNLRNNSSVTFTNANVMRAGSFYDANVSAIQTRLNSEDNTYFVSAKTSISNIFENQKVNTGFNTSLRLGKHTGNFIFNSGLFVESNRYNPNDLGFNPNNNKRIFDVTVGYRKFKPFWILNQLYSSLGFYYNRLYLPNVFTSAGLSGSLTGINKKFNASGFDFYASLVDSYDYFEPRAENRYFVRPRWLDLNWWYSSNYQKRFAIDASIAYTLIDRDKWQEFGFRISPRWRVSNRIFLIYDFDQSYSKNGQGFAIPFGIPSEDWNGILFGQRDRINTVNGLQLKVSFTSIMSLGLRVRHYRSSVSYDGFFDLSTDGTLSSITYSGLQTDGSSAFNTNYNAFTIDCAYRWVFMPGSEVNLVWKQSIFSSDKSVQNSYFQNLSNLFDYLPTNSLSLKVLYWLDYQSLKKLKKKPV
jgi:hypothetical protein